MGYYTCAVFVCPSQCMVFSLYTKILHIKELLCPHKPVTTAGPATGHATRPSPAGLAPGQATRPRPAQMAWPWPLASGLGHMG